MNNSPKTIILEILRENGWTFDTKANKILEEVNFMVDKKSQEEYQAAYQEGWTDGFDEGVRETLNEKE